MALLDDGWHIANIIYDNGKSLIDHLRETTGCWFRLSFGRGERRTFDLLHHL